tara:strand:+ start:1034 stop:1528 length:495 start_codon:yes stop_codon:yes gene_type:complete
MLLGKRVLILFGDAVFQWIELKEIRHIKACEFKVIGDSNWYSNESIVDIPNEELYNSNICLNCKLPVKHSQLCKGSHCLNDFNVCTDIGFFTASSNCEDFRDNRLTKYPNLRENLWSNDEENTNMHYCEKLYSIKDAKFLPKSKFADRRLKWSNRGKRYNLHPR